MNSNGGHIQQAMIPAGVTAREDSLGRELVRHAEQQAQAVASMVRAQVESRYKMALARPRDWSDVRVKLLNECKRPAFCESAIYTLPRGGQKIQGPSIRFAEAVLRCMSNVLPETRVLVDDDTKRIVQVSVTDLEANITYTHEIVVSKTVERKAPRDREVVLSERTNSLGQRTFTIAATDDDITMKQNAGVSKALRTLALRLLPGDILDDALAQIDETFRKGGDDPAADRKRVEDAFASINVLPTQLGDYLGVPLAQASPAQVRELRQLFAAVRDGQVTFAEALAEVREGRGDGTKSAEPSKPTQAERMKETTKARAAKPKPAAKPGWDALEVGAKWNDPDGVVHEVFWNENLKCKGIRPVEATGDDPPAADDDGAREDFE
jgi:hypothetical protein